MKMPQNNGRRTWLIAGAIIMAGILISVLILMHPFANQRSGQRSDSWTPQEKTDGKDDETSYIVRFYAADGTLMEEKTVWNGNSVLPPSVKVPGRVFKGWSRQLNAIRADTEVYAQLTSLDPEAKNAVIGDAVYADCTLPILIPIRLDGDVDCSGFVIEVAYDAELLSFEAAEQTLPGLVAELNAEQGIVTLRYSGEILSDPVQLAELRFSCRLPGGWKTVLPIVTREIVTQRGNETVFTDSVAYDVELYLFDNLQNDKKE